MAKKFLRARRHSSRVRLLRIGLPIGIVLIVGAIFGLAYFNPVRMLTRLPLDPGKVTISGTKVTMAAPKLAGFTNDQRAYELTAEAASQDVTNPNFLELHGIRAKIELQDKATVELTAANGSYDRKSELLTLLDDILLTSSTGYEARLTQAVVDVKGGNVVSSQPVQVKLLNGTLTSDRLEVANKGEVALFEGNVVMILKLDNNTARPAPKAAQ
ncbi:MAG: LPS export ABC transporter periplasmic protein LptC [Xanthobacteraceae bacterium]